MERSLNAYIDFAISLMQMINYDALEIFQGCLHLCNEAMRAKNKNKDVLEINFICPKSQ